ncbi:tyrosine-protein phosphatase [Pseudonocardia sp. C8]|uniref:tyrosine-protein phosphatase n=1 Tax=Pseudonocardia sp. C8 TaxID=2762759 RepID=UPI001642FF89|nr:tyrosine-protein phosphatase [Pseudonocardia sp. C8]
MTAGLDAPRDQDVPGAYNVRDAGGYPTATGQVARGLLYRSAGLQHLGADGRAALVALGLRTVVDLRSSAERTAAPSALAGTGITVLDRPVHEGGTGLVDDGDVPTLARLYERMLSGCATGLVAAVRELARPGALPALVHCAAGKDRTGIVVALVLSATGVPDEVVAADYALTAARLPESFFAGLPVPEHLGEAALTALHAIYRDSPAEVMHGLLRTLRTEYGGARAYLLDHGMTGDELDALVAALDVTQEES